MASRRLAILGGVPAFAEPLHVGRPNVGDRAALLARINDALDRRWLTNNGRYVSEFEDRVAAHVGARHCVAVANGTLALQLAAAALDLRGEVIVPSLTFVATAHALAWKNLIPVFCDVTPGTYTIDPADVEKRITPRTTAILGVHLWGRPCAIDELSSVARRHGLHLFFDAAHAFGCSYRGKMIGTFGDAEIFSFHATKYVGALEGGAVVTNDDSLARRLRRLRNQGIEEGTVLEVGINATMNEICAAMGLTSLDALDDFIAANERSYQLYRDRLANLEYIRVAAFDAAERNNYQYVALEVAADSPITRDDLLAVLKAEGVLARCHCYPACHEMEPYRLFARSPELPQTDRLSRSLLTLPSGPSVSSAQAEQVCRIIADAFEQAPALADVVVARPALRGY